MARVWLINGKGIAKKIKNPTHFSNRQIKDVGTEANRECPNCKNLIDNSDVTLEWPGLPAGVKFDPTGAELLHHLKEKVGLGNSKSHIFIDEFIPTLQEDQGICYTHPENLPGVKKDGRRVHFFHRTSNAYATGQRKRRKIDRDFNTTSEERVRWHKTGKTKPVMDNGVRKGWKKIMVLYRSFKKGCKPDRANWVMHQYHLGIEEDEKDGEMVVSKIFYQQNEKQTDKIDDEQVQEESEVLTVGVGPRTPKTNTPQLMRPKEHSLSPEAPESSLDHLGPQNGLLGVEIPLSVVDHKDKVANALWREGESRAVEEVNPNILVESLLCNEKLDNFASGESSMRFDYNNPEFEVVSQNTDMFCGFPALDDIEMDTPPDFQLADLQFGSQDSITSWLDRL